MTSHTHLWFVINLRSQGSSYCVEQLLLHSPEPPGCQGIGRRHWSLIAGMRVP